MRTVIVCVMDAENKQLRPPRSPQSGNPAGGETPARMNSRTLLGSRSELIIEHDGREYRLRLTQNGKLILTA